MKIKLQRKQYLMRNNNNDDAWIEIDTDTRDSEIYRAGALIACVAPWATEGCPLTLEIAICPDGEILHRGWSWRDDSNCYLHTRQSAADVTVTSAMQAVLAGLWSGRISVDGLVIAVGASCQHVCPLDLAA